MKKFFIVSTVMILFFTFQLGAIEVGKWDFVVDDNYCYIISVPTKEEGDYTQRGDTYVLVYRINKSPDKIVQITAGYNYDEKKSIIVSTPFSIAAFANLEDGSIPNTLIPFDLNADNRTPELLPTSITKEFSFRLNRSDISTPIFVKCSLPIFVVDESYG